MTTSSKFQNTNDKGDLRVLYVLHGKGEMVYAPGMWHVQSYAKDMMMYTMDITVTETANAFKIVEKVLACHRKHNHNFENALEPSFGYLVPIDKSTGERDTSDLLFWHINASAECEKLEAAAWKQIRGGGG